MGDTCDIKLGNQVVVGTYPRLPMRYLLQRQLQQALGYTEADMQEIGELEPGDPMPDPSEPGDGYAIACVYAAVVGVCWPNPLPVPTLKSLRHDAVAYGEAVMEHFLSSDRTVAEALTKEGRRLLHDMIQAGAGALKEAIAQERDFTEGRGPASTVG